MRVRSSNNRNRAGGFTMIELAVVIGIMLLIAAMMTPSMLRIIAQIKLRSSASTLAGLMQTARMRAVRDDRFYSVIQDPAANRPGQFCVDLNWNGSCQNDEPTAAIAGNVVVLPAGGPDTSEITCGALGGACPAGYTGGLNYVSEPRTAVITFGPRGLPCVNNPVATRPVWGANNCRTIDAAGNQVGFLWVLQYTGAVNVSFAAVATTPAGRISAWSYTGIDRNGNAGWTE
jgi:Tfp pilus assembly protein FimT